MFRSVVVCLYHTHSYTIVIIVTLGVMSTNLAATPAEPVRNRPAPAGCLLMLGLAVFIVKIMNGNGKSYGLQGKSY